MFKQLKDVSLFLLSRKNTKNKIRCCDNMSTNTEIILSLEKKILVVSEN